MTAIRNLTMTRGDTKKWDFTVTDENDAAVSLASHAGFWFTAKRSIADSDASAIFQKHLATGATSGSGFSIAAGAGGTGSVQLSPSDTSGLEDAIVQLSYDIQFIDVNANKYTAAIGKLTVRPDVTLA